ncbi:MAG: hypothetical protein A2176_11940 [Spirochaetes bacterium RBG_13_51_14]|nr:MAG: hypothetical protein A2176_11940 [Spirochaetes bacterium RBG_13_51_14]
MRKSLKSAAVYGAVLLVTFTAVACKKFDNSAIDLSTYEKKVFSQNGEDGVMEKIIDVIGVYNRYYVEIGTGVGTECNTRNLRENHGFTGVMMDGCCENKKINLFKEFLTKENINDILSKYNVPEVFDVLSIDIDGNDFYIWHAFDKKYRPQLIVIEYNVTHLPGQDKVIEYKPDHVWDKTNYYGASITALYNLGRYKGYSLVYADKRGVNLFFVRDDVLSKIENKFLNMNDVDKIYRNPKLGPGPNGGWYDDVKKRKYVTSQSILKI